MMLRKAVGSAGVGLLCAVSASGLALSSRAVAATAVPALRLTTAAASLRDSAGAIWTPDTPYALGGSRAAATAPIPGTASPALYQHERWNVAGYRIPVPVKGTYTVKLFESELFFNAAGQRVFDVTAEGQKVVTSLDVFQRVGKDRPHQVWFTVPVTDGSLDLSFVRHANFAKVDALEVDGPAGSGPIGAPAPNPTPTPAPPPGPPGTTDGSVLWNGDFSTGNLSQWQALLAAADRGVVYTGATQPSWPAPPTPGGHAVRLSAANTDFRSPNVRAQLNGPNVIRENQDVYYHWKTFIPSDFPNAAATYPGFYTFASTYGYPFDGVGITGAFGLASDGAGGLSVVYSRSAEYNYDHPWQVPLVKGRWMDFVFHLKTSQNPASGYVEIWFNGQLQRFWNGSTRLMMQTWRANNTEGMYPELTNYRKVDTYPGTVTIYHADARLGTTYSAATR